jgi:D-psicose/D-tagatose/L-ribulose 3-epimerase
MKLAVSAIAWSESEEEASFRILQEEGTQFIECVPARFLEDPIGYKSRLKGYGLNAVACQALLFGTHGLHLFENAESRRALLRHLIEISKAAGALGARAMVFGSPKARSIDFNFMTYSSATDIALDFFKELSVHVWKAGCTVCIEPNPSIYGCNFLTSTAETLEFVTKVDTPGVGLNIDLGALAINGEDPLQLMKAGLNLIGHLHISEPNLLPVLGKGSQSASHCSLRSALKSLSYDGVVSIEMARDRKISWTEWSDKLRQSIKGVKDFYEIR